MKHEKQAFLWTVNVTVQWYDRYTGYLKSFAFKHVQYIEIHVYGIQGKVLWNSSLLILTPKCKKNHLHLYLTNEFYNAYFLAYFKDNQKTKTIQNLLKKKKKVKILQESGMQNLKYKRSVHLGHYRFMAHNFHQVNSFHTVYEIFETVHLNDRLIYSSHLLLTRCKI